MPHPRERTPTTECASLPIYAGCPHCGGPVNIRRHIHKERADALRDVLALLEADAPRGDFEKAIRAMLADEDWLSERTPEGDSHPCRDPTP